MDLFDDYMSIRVINECGIFCNQSSHTYTEHSGGDVLFLTLGFKNDWMKTEFNKFFSKDTEVFNISTTLKEFISCFNFNTYSNTTHCQMVELVGESMTTTEKLATLDIMLELMSNELDETEMVYKKAISVEIGLDTTSFRFKKCLKTYNIGLNTKLIISKQESGVYLKKFFDSKGVEIKIKGLVVKNRSKFVNSKIMIDVNLKIGIMSLNFQNDAIKIFHKGHLITTKIINYHNDFVKLVTLYNSLKFWQDEPSKGVCFGSSDGIRSGVTVLHSLTVQEIVDKIGLGYKPRRDNIGFKKCYVEGMLQNFCVELLGETNASILQEVTSKLDSSEIDKEELISDVLNLHSSITLCKKYL